MTVAISPRFTPFQSVLFPPTKEEMEREIDTQAQWPSPTGMLVWISQKRPTVAGQRGREGAVAFWIKEPERR